MTLAPSKKNWFLIDNASVEGLGGGELFQSTLVSVEFKANVVLNNYESNCFRDWLSQRWRASSLEQTSIVLLQGSGLLITRMIQADNLADAKNKFRDWLCCVSKERQVAFSN